MTGFFPLKYKAKSLEESSGLPGHLLITLVVPFPIICYLA